MNLKTQNSFHNRTHIGPFLLVLLFLGSTEFTERISSSTYTDYADFKKMCQSFSRESSDPINNERLLKRVITFRLIRIPES
jgi:hypothetical protein